MGEGALGPLYVSDTYYPNYQEPSTAVTAVAVKIQRLSDGYFFDFDDSTFKDAGWTTKSASLTEKTEGSWVYTAGWTIPSSTTDEMYKMIYEVTDADQTFDVGGEIIRVELTGQTAVVSIPTVNKRTFLQLKQSLARRADIDSTNDTQGMTLLGEIINDEQQFLIQQVPDAYFLEDSDTVTCTASQAYVTLPADMDWTNVERVVDEDNDVGIELWTLYDHTGYLPDPTGTGIPRRAWFWQVDGTLRLYLDPIPASTYTLRLYFRNRMGQLTNDADYAIIPAKYENILLDGAFIRFKEWYNPDDLTLTSIRERYARELEQFIYETQFRHAGRTDTIDETRPARYYPAPRWPVDFPEGRVT